MEVVARHFRPEFINRIDDLVVFHALQREQIRAIAEIQIQHLARRLREQDLGLKVSTAAKDFLGHTGFDPVYGARPLKRAVQSHLETPLAREILAGRFAPGDTIEVDVTAGELAFRKESGRKRAGGG